jgi:hypothetical protein
MGVKFARQTYGGRPTKWVFISRFYDYKRDKWKTLRERMKALFLEGKLAAGEYLETLNMEKNPSWEWIQSKLDRASTKKDPTGALGQIDIYKLEEAVKDLDRQYRYCERYIRTIESSPLEECPGWVFNQKFHVTQEERQAVIDNETGYTEEVDLTV